MHLVPERRNCNQLKIAQESLRPQLCASSVTTTLLTTYLMNHNVGRGRGEEEGSDVKSGRRAPQSAIQQNGLIGRPCKYDNWRPYICGEILLSFHPFHLRNWQDRRLARISHWSWSTICGRKWPPRTPYHPRSRSNVSWIGGGHRAKAAGWAQWTIDDG